jgi:hypothetical protein
VDDDRSIGGGGNLKGQARSNQTHESTTDSDARLFHKGKTASELYFIGQMLSDNRHGRIASAMFTVADGHAEREVAKAMVLRCPLGHGRRPQDHARR